MLRGGRTFERRRRRPKLPRRRQCRSHGSGTGYPATRQPGSGRRSAGSSPAAWWSMWRWDPRSRWSSAPVAGERLWPAASRAIDFIHSTSYCW